MGTDDPSQGCFEASIVSMCLVHGGVAGIEQVIKTLSCGCY